MGSLSFSHGRDDSNTTAGSFELLAWHLGEKDFAGKAHFSLGASLFENFLSFVCNFDNLESI